MKPYSFALEDTDPLRLFAALHDQPYSLWLDSADRAHPLARYSFIAFHPFETIESRNGRVTVTNRDQQLTISGDPFAVLEARIDAYGLDLRDDRLQHRGGRTDDKAADGCTADHDELGRLVQDEQVAAGHEIATDDRAENDDEADDYEHSSLSEARSHARTMSGSK